MKALLFLNIIYLVHQFVEIFNDCVIVVLMSHGSWPSWSW